MRDDPNAGLGATESTSDEDVACDECGELNGLHHHQCSSYDPFDPFDAGYMEGE